jgi:F-type H+-transporting ATPase subunit alpha
VIDPLGNPLDGKGPIVAEERALCIPPNNPSILAHASITDRLYSGVKVIDGFHPIGHGQRLALIGRR